MRSSMGTQPSREISRGSPELGSEGSSEEDGQTLEELLDDGALTTNSRDRDFTNFLDLKIEHHTEFINRLKEYAQKYGHRWKELKDSEDDRRKCAERFTEDNGMRYWGTPVNREKYLSPQTENDGAPCIYPDDEQVIVRVLMILLERKAKAHCKSDEKQDDEPTRDSMQNSARKAISEPLSASKVTMRNKKRDDRKKRKRHTQTDYSSEDEQEPPKKVVNTPKETTAPTTKTPSKDRAKQSTPHSIRPFGTIADVETESARSKPSKKTKTPAPATHPKTGADESPLPHVLPDTKATQRRLEQEEAPYEKYTMLHVSASNQQMAPVWVPFGKFKSSSAFLEHMWEECKLSQVKSTPQPVPQPNQLDSNWQNNPAAMQWVVAASVKFEWSGLEIRVRRGFDRDLKYIRGELEKAWNNKEQNPSGPENFRIFVMLHIIG